MPDYLQNQIADLLQQCDNAPNTDIKGDKLEELTTYLFSNIPGVQFERKNVLDGLRAHELDVVFWNPQQTSQLFFFDPILIVECKASANRVGSNQVGWFVRKLQDRGAHTAVLIALNGVTGNQLDPSSAASEIFLAMVRDKIKILVLTRAEIEGMHTTEQLVEILRQKFLQLTLDRVVAFERGEE